jgi:AraC family transcriptional regulator of adaptative response/methylated-DNA-[protein]-cysteine methyltransferase
MRVDAVAAAARLIDDAVDGGSKPPSLGALASGANVSASTLRRAFAAATGLTPHGYADARRAQRLRDALADGAHVSHAIHDSGFGSLSRVYEHSGSLLGMTPAVFRGGAPGETMSYAFASTTIGRIVVTMTDRGVSMIAFGDDDSGLLAEVRRRFPHAELEPADGRRGAWVDTVISLVEQPAEAAGLPLDVRGTAFQQRVWIALRRVPAGETISYAELARRIGRPTARGRAARTLVRSPSRVTA